MNKRIWMILSTLIVIGALLLGACASSPIILPIEPTAIASSESTANATQSSSQTAETSQGGSLSGAAPSSGSPPEGAPTSGSPPNGDMNGGAGPSGASSSATDGLSTATGAYTLDGQMQPKRVKHILHPVRMSQLSM